MGGSRKHKRIQKALAVPQTSSTDASDRPRELESLIIASQMALEHATSVTFVTWERTLDTDWAAYLKSGTSAQYSKSQQAFTAWLSSQSQVFKDASHLYDIRRSKLGGLLRLASLSNTMAAALKNQRPDAVLATIPYLSAVEEIPHSGSGRHIWEPFDPALIESALARMKILAVADPVIQAKIKVLRGVNDIASIRFDVAGNPVDSQAAASTLKAVKQSYTSLGNLDDKLAALSKNWQADDLFNVLQSQSALLALTPDQVLTADNVCLQFPDGIAFFFHGGTWYQNNNGWSTLTDGQPCPSALSSQLTTLFSASVTASNAESTQCQNLSDELVNATTGANLIALEKAVQDCDTFVSNLPNLLVQWQSSNKLVESYMAALCELRKRYIAADYNSLISARDTITKISKITGPFSYQGQALPTLNGKPVVPDLELLSALSQLVSTFDVIDIHGTHVPWSYYLYLKAAVDREYNGNFTGLNPTSSSWKDEYWYVGTRDIMNTAQILFKELEAFTKNPNGPRHAHLSQRHCPSSSGWWCSFKS